MRNILALLALALLLLGCDLAEDTKGEAEDAGGIATGIAKKSSKGTLGNYDDEGNLIEEEDADDDDDGDGDDETE